MNLIIKFINFIVNLFIGFINLLIDLLPNSPIENIKLNLDNELLQYMNWLIPINEILQLITIFTTCYISYLAISFIFRFFKVVK